MLRERERSNAQAMLHSGYGPHEIALLITISRAAKIEIDGLVDMLDNVTYDVRELMMNVQVTRP